MREEPKLLLSHEEREKYVYDALCELSHMDIEVIFANREEFGVMDSIVELARLLRLMLAGLLTETNRADAELKSIREVQQMK